MVQRDYLPYFLTLLNLNGAGVEVGVADGNFSEHFLKNSHISTFYTIDPWQTFDDDIYHDISNVGQNEQDRRYNRVMHRLRKYGERSKILRMTAHEAAQRFNPMSLDFIYIDANHTYAECKKDLNCWWPKLKNGGVFAGHDYVNGELFEGSFGVKKAVDEFVKEHGQKLFVTYEEWWPTWYIIKNSHILNRLLKAVLYNILTYKRMEYAQN